MLKTLKTAALALACALVATAAIAQTPTTNYGWLKPTVGASANAWGNNLNSDLDGIDSTVFGISGVANAACPKAGCTFTGLDTFNLGLTSLTTVDALTPNNGSTGGFRLRGNATTGNAYLQVTDSTGGSQWGYATITSAGGLTWSGAIGASGGFTGNAATSSQWQTTRTETLSGPVTGSASVNGAGNWTINTSIANSGVGSGTYGYNNGAAYPVFSVGPDGRVTGAYNQAISYPAPTQSQVFSALGLSSNLNGASPSSVSIPTPSGTVIINWGAAYSIGGGGNYSYTFPAGYSNTVQVIAGGSSSYCSAQSISNSGFTIHNNGSGTQNCYWIAIGS